jgi:hypothetical protein
VLYFALRDPHSVPSLRHQMLYAEQVFWIRPKLLDGPPRVAKRANEVHVLDAGHFAIDTKADEIAALVRGFMSTQK